MTSAPVLKAANFGLLFKLAAEGWGMSCRKTLMVSVTSPRGLSGTSASVPRWEKEALALILFPETL